MKEKEPLKDMAGEAAKQYVPQQSYQDQIISISEIKTGYLVKSKNGWFAFPTMQEVCNHLQSIARAK